MYAEIDAWAHALNVSISTNDQPRLRAEMALSLSLPSAFRTAKALKRAVCCRMRLKPRGTSCPRKERRSMSTASCLAPERRCCPEFATRYELMINARPPKPSVYPSPGSLLVSAELVR